MLTMTDLFAGAGGTSTGAASVPGVHVAIAANHWKLAVNVHAENHQSSPSEAPTHRSPSPHRWTRSRRPGTTTD